MDFWDDDPPEPTEFAGVRLIRCAPAKPIQAHVTSEKLVGKYTHFAHRRTQPCLGPDCPLCLEATPKRWHAYLSICSIPNRFPAVLELTALATAPIAEYQRMKGSLRGALIHAIRHGNKPNSPVTVTIAASDVDLRTLPRGVNLPKFLCTIWSIPYDDATGQPDPHRGPNIRNTHVADTPTSSPQPLPLDDHPFPALPTKTNGRKR